MGRGCAVTDGVASVLCGCVQALMNRIDSAVARLGGFRALKKTLSGALHDHKIQSRTLLKRPGLHVPSALFLGPLRIYCRNEHAYCTVLSQLSQQKKYGPRRGLMIYRRSSPSHVRWRAQYRCLRGQMLGWRCEMPGGLWLAAREAGYGRAPAKGRSSRVVQPFFF